MTSMAVQKKISKSCHERSVKLIDTLAAFGGALNPNASGIAKKDLLMEMKRLTISMAIVRPLLLPQGGDVVTINQRLLQNCSGDPRLIPCPLMIPAGAGDLPSEEEQADFFLKQGARMVWIRPGPDRYNLMEVVSGRMFNALAKRRLPVLCLMDLVSLADMDMLLRRHAGLRIIAANVGYGQLRVILPMLKFYSGFYLATGRGAADHDFLPCMERSGVIHKIFFGTGFPEAEPTMAVTQLMFTDISEKNRRAVGAENILRLLDEVQP